MITLYGNEFSSPSNKVRYVANALGIEYEYKHVDLMGGANKTESYLKLNPSGKVPVIQDGDFTLFESNAIIRYLARKVSSSLYPQDLKRGALVDQWMDFASLHVAQAVGRVFFNRVAYKFLNAEVDPRSLSDGLQFLQRFLPVLEGALAKSAFLAGPELSLADFSLLAGLDQAEVAGIELEVYPALSQWRKELIAKDFYQKCFSSYAAMLHALTQKAS
ncbi:MAG: glutathione S-transferase family protein [Deltaproteobacteria bacterium]|nr:glutathione S-transferase family protein [Deltaproteobacteria bacterium]